MSDEQPGFVSWILIPLPSDAMKEAWWKPSACRSGLTTCPRWENWVRGGARETTPRSPNTSDRWAFNRDPLLILGYLFPNGSPSLFPSRGCEGSIEPRRENERNSLKEWKQLTKRLRVPSGELPSCPAWSLLASGPNPYSPEVGNIPINSSASLVFSHHRLKTLLFTNASHLYCAFRSLLDCL